MNVTWHPNGCCVSLAKVPLTVYTTSHGTSSSSIILLVQSRRTCTGLSSMWRIPGILVFFMTRRRTNSARIRHFYLEEILGHHLCPHCRIRRVSPHLQRNRNHHPVGVEKSVHWPLYRNNQAQQKSSTWTRLLHYQDCIRIIQTSWPRH